jgi:hypothetical protein
MGGHLIRPNGHNQMGIQLCTKDIIVSCVPKVRKNIYIYLFIINQVLIQVHFKDTFKIVSQT